MKPRPSQVLYLQNNDCLSDDYNSDEDDNDIERRHETDGDLIRDANINGALDNPYQSDGHSSHYNDDHFENDEDPFREDVSSEGSCL